MRGRRPVGPELAEQLGGSDEARRRMHLILATVAGAVRVKEACAELGISAQRFEALRAGAVRAGIAALEPKPTGRPARVAPEHAPEVAGLAARIAELEGQLQSARVQAELVGQLPRRGRSAAKKARPRSARAKESHRSGPGHPKPTH